MHNLSPRIRTAALCGLAGLCLAISPLLPAVAADGPTPFPTAESDWPGKGPVRCFPWMKDNRAWFWTKRAEAQGAVVFAGDSLIGNWGNLAKAFPKLHVANRGIGGDVTRGLLFRFQEDVLDLKPRAIVILIGSNDLSAKAPVAGIISNISDMLDLVAKQAPGTPVILCEIVPRNSPQAPIDPSQVPETNAALKKLVEGRKDVTLFDSNSLFALPDGSPDPQYFKSDKLHFGDAGYAKFAAALDKVFTDMKLQ